MAHVENKISDNLESSSQRLSNSTRSFTKTDSSATSDASKLSCYDAPSPVLGLYDLREGLNSTL